MYTITIFTAVNDIYHSDFLFENYNDAKNFLLDKGYKEENRWFIRNTNGWYEDSKAIINKIKIYKRVS